MIKKDLLVEERRSKGAKRGLSDAVCLAVKQLRFEGLGLIIPLPTLTLTKIVSTLSNWPHMDKSDPYLNQMYIRGPRTGFFNSRVGLVEGTLKKATIRFSLLLISVAK